MAPPVESLRLHNAFGSMNYRRSVAAPQGLTALWWYQGESDDGSSAYLTAHRRFITEAREEMGADLPVIYVQLAKSSTASLDVRYHSTGEFQRQMETASGTPHELPAHHMVVIFDQGLLDPSHINLAGQKELGRRIALATRQHVFGEAVNGTGPRLLRRAPLIHPNNERRCVRIRFDKPINEAVNAYDGQFRAYDNAI